MRVTCKINAGFFTMSNPFNPSETMLFHSLHHLIPVFGCHGQTTSGTPRVHMADIHTYPPQTNRRQSTGGCAMLQSQGFKNHANQRTSKIKNTTVHLTAAPSRTNVRSRSLDNWRKTRRRPHVRGADSSGFYHHRIPLSSGRQINEYYSSILNWSHLTSFNHASWIAVANVRHWNYRFGTLQHSSIQLLPVVILPLYMLELRAAMTRM